MKCPSCGHVNLTEFPFCEQCLVLLPQSVSEGKAPLFQQDVMITGDDDAVTSSVAWPAFPWNPPQLKDPHVGREYAVDELLAGWNVVRNWEARIHLLLADYGLGKSRVASVFVDRALKRENEAWVIRIDCPRYGGRFRLWDTLLKTAFGISLSADDVEAGQGLLEATNRYLPDEATDVAALIAFLTGWDVPGRAEIRAFLDREAMISRSTAALARLFNAMCMERPLLIVIDHADRASAQSLTIAGALETILKQRPCMIVLTGPPELAQTLPGWDRFPRTQLGPLLKEDAERLTRLFLSGLGDLPIELVDAIVERSNGSPHAIKATIRYLRETGVIREAKAGYVLDTSVQGALDLPEDLEGMFLARVAQLKPQDRSLLARAAIIGRVFWLGCLISLERQGDREHSQMGETIQDNRPGSIRKRVQALIKRGFLESRTCQIPGEEAYAFKSAAQWQVATTLLPEAQSQAYHAVVEQWMLLQVHDTQDPFLEELAHHAEAAGAEGRASGYLLRAARAANRDRQPVEERRLLLSAQALVNEDDAANYLNVHVDLGDAMLKVGDLDLALKCFQETLESAWRMRNRRHGARALSRIGKVMSERGEYKNAYQHFHRALQLFEAVNDTIGVAETCTALGRLCWLDGNFDDAVTSYTKAEDLFSAQQNQTGIAAAIHARATIHIERGDLSAAEKAYNQALELRRTLEDAPGVATTLNDLGIIWSIQDRPQAAIEAWEEGCSIAVEIGERAIESALRDSYGHGLIRMGRYEDALKQLYQGLDVAEAIGSKRTLAYIEANIASACEHLGRFDDCRNHLEKASQHAEDLGLKRVLALVDRGRGDLLAGQIERAMEAERAAGDESSQAESSKGKKKKKKKKKEAPQEQAQSNLSAEVDESLRLYRRAIGILTEGGYDEEAAQTHDRVALFLQAIGRQDEANAEMQAASALRELHQ